MTVHVPFQHELVLVGGGHAHVAVLKRFGMQPLQGLRLTLVSPASKSPYSGMLPGLIAGHYQPHETHVELRPLCRFAAAQFIQAPITGLDLSHRHIVFRDRPPIAFDTLSINTGSTPALASIPGALAHGLPVKPVDRFLEGWAHWVEHATQAPPPRSPRRIVVVGGGAGSVELIFALRHRWRMESTGTSGSLPPAEFHLVTAADSPLPTHGRAVQRLAARCLQQQGIHVHTRQRVIEANSSEIVTADGKRLGFDALVWAIHAGAPTWIADSGLATDPAGFIAVHPSLQSTSHPFVFAAGDTAAVLEFPRPKSGVFAVRQGPPLAENLRRAAQGHAPLPFRPQSRALNLIATGNRHAIASYGPLALAGRWIWTVKDWIDRRWMRGYQELPTMGLAHGSMAKQTRGGSTRPSPSAIATSHQHSTPDDHDQTAGGLRPDPPATEPFAPIQQPCGGCAAKVPAEVLHRVLRRLAPHSKPGILIGLDAPDDAAVVIPPPGLALVQTLDSFRTWIDDPYLFGRIATLHGLNDLFAMGAEPHSALALATIPFGSAHAVEETLFQVLSGALLELVAHQTALIGGHSAEGPELAFGVSLNGFAPPDRLLRKAGLQPGDQLILTKPLGTGTLFAADMMGKARGQWIDDALRGMQISGRAAAQGFLQHQATACTDVSGFGLAGHLLEMLRASGVSAALQLDSVPALDGALVSLRAGWFSSLHSQNRLACRALADRESYERDNPRYELLFDPQTSGGLLAGVPAHLAECCLRTLHRTGFPQASVIGTVEALPGASSQPLIRWATKAR